MFIQRVRNFPTPGKAFEFRAALEEWVKKSQAQGLDVSLSTQLFAPEGTTFVVTTRFRDLAEFENRRRQTLADPAYQAFVAKLGLMTREASKFELLEVLVPFPR